MQYVKHNFGKYYTTAILQLGSKYSLFQSSYIRSREGPVDKIKNFGIGDPGSFFFASAGQKQFCTPPSLLFSRIREGGKDDRSAKLTTRLHLTQWLGIHGSPFPRPCTPSMAKYLRHTVKFLTLETVGYEGDLGVHWMQ